MGWDVSQPIFSLRIFIADLHNAIFFTMQKFRLKAVLWK